MRVTCEWDTYKPWRNWFGYTNIANRWFIFDIGPFYIEFGRGEHQ
jgi:hypothetical protein